MKDKKVQSQELDEETVPFDDCLRLLVNTPPKPKRGEEKQNEIEGEREGPKQQG